jgi:hypothetical protein
MQWNHTKRFRTDKLPWCCQRGTDKHLGSYVNISEILQWRRGGRRSSTNSFVNFDIVTGSETVTMKLSSKYANWHIHILYVYALVLLQNVFYLHFENLLNIWHFFKAGVIMISRLNFYSLFTVMILIVIHFTCNYLSNAPFYFFHFHCIPNQQHLSSSIFQRIKKKLFFKFGNYVSSSTKIPSLGLCTFSSRFLYVMS